MSLENGTTVENGFKIAEKVTRKHPTTAFIIMTYLNVVYRYGYAEFMKKAQDCGISGLIVPDLALENCDDYFIACDKHRISPILMITPNSSRIRIKEVVRE